MKKYVRPFVALVLVLCLCVSLAGCSMELTDMLMLKQAYQHVKEMDSLRFTVTAELDAVAELRDRGATLEEAYQWAEANKLRVHHWFFSTDLQHYKRGGRISASSALLGTILGICPLLNMDNHGHLIPRKKVKGKNSVIREIVKKMEQHAEGGLEYSGKCFISYSACYDDARKVADLVEATFPKLNGKVMINSIGTVIGSHTGIGTVALFFFGDERVD